VAPSPEKARGPVAGNGGDTTSRAGTCLKFRHPFFFAGADVFRLLLDVSGSPDSTRDTHLARSSFSPDACPANGTTSSFGLKE
jgi:hypothetical protein